MCSSWRAWLLGATILTGSGCIEPLPSPRPPVMVRSFSGTLIPGDYVSPTAYEHYLLAELHSQHGRPEDAVDELRRAIAGDGASAYLRTRLCEELLTIGRIDEAREEVEAALALDSEFAEAHVDRARVLMRLGDRSGAEVSLRRAIDIDPRCQDAYVTLVGLYRLSRGAGGGGDSAKVEATWRALARAVPSSARAHQALGHLLVERGVEPEVERAHHAANRVLPIPVESEAERELLARAAARSHVDRCPARSGAAGPAGGAPRRSGAHLCRGLPAQPRSQRSRIRSGDAGASGPARTGRRPVSAARRGGRRRAPDGHCRPALARRWSPGTGARAGATGDRAAR